MPAIRADNIEAIALLLYETRDWAPAATLVRDSPSPKEHGCDLCCSHATDTAGTSLCLGALGTGASRAMRSD
jgi:hypothetical protein